MFCLNCIFVIDAAVKQLISRSFLKCGVSAVNMAAHNFFFKLNQIFILGDSFHYDCTEAYGNERRGPTPLLSARATQL